MSGRNRALELFKQLWSRINSFPTYEFLFICNFDASTLEGKKRRIATNSKGYNLQYNKISDEKHEIIIDNNHGLRLLATLEKVDSEYLYASGKVSVRLFTKIYHLIAPFLLICPWTIVFTIASPKGGFILSSLIIFIHLIFYFVYMALEQKAFIKAFKNALRCSQLR